MILETYIKQEFNTEEILPFNLPVFNYRKGTNITNLGDIEHSICFVVSGITELCTLHNGEEKIMEFVFENEFISSLSSIAKQKTADVYIKCLTDCIIQEIPYKDLIEAVESSSLARDVYQHVMENDCLSKVEIAKDILVRNANEKYLELLTDRPNVIREVPLRHIANFIGVHPNSLSRIRKQLFSTKQVAKRELKAA